MARTFSTGVSSGMPMPQSRISLPPLFHTVSTISLTAASTSAGVPVAIVEASSPPRKATMSPRT